MCIKNSSVVTDTISIKCNNEISHSITANGCRTILQDSWGINKDGSIKYHSHVDLVNNTEYVTGSK